MPYFCSLITFSIKITNFITYLATLTIVHFHLHEQKLSGGVTLSEQCHIFIECHLKSNYIKQPNFCCYK